MPDATNAAPTPTPAAPAAPAAKIEVVFRGQKQEIDLTKPENVAEVKRLVQIGKNDEYQRNQMQERLRALETQAREREKQLAAWNEIERFNQSNPVAGRAWAAAYEKLRHGEITPEQLLASLNGKGPTEGEPAAPAPTSAGADAQTRAELAELRSTLQGVAAELQSSRKATAEQERVALVNATLDRDEMLRARPGTKEIVRDRILAAMDRGSSLEEATNLETQRIREVLSEAATAEVQRRQAGEEMRTIPANAGVPPIRDYAPPKLDPKSFRTPEAYMKEGWKQSKDKAREFARATMRAAVQGPNT